MSPPAVVFAADTDRPIVFQLSHNLLAYRVVHALEHHVVTIGVVGLYLERCTISRCSFAVSGLTSFDPPSNVGRRAARGPERARYGAIGLFVLRTSAYKC